MLKNKSLLIGIAVIIIIVVLGGGYFLFAKRSANSPQQTTNQQSQNDGTVQTLSPDDIGLTLTATSDNKKVKFSVAKLQGIKSVEYELTYQADATQQEKSEGADAQV